MAERKPLFMDATEGFSEEMAITDTATFGGLTLSGDIAMAGNEVTGLPATPSGATAATSKAYVDQIALTGGPVKAAVLHNTQLDGTDGINAAAALTFAAQPVSGDTIVLTDGTTTRTYGAGTGGDVQYTIGATVADSMTNLAAAIEADGSAIWGAAFTTNLDAIDTDGVVVIIEDANSGTAPRVYGVWGTQASIQHVDFDGENDYTSKSLTQLDAADPTASNPNFGFRTVQLSLTDGEIHYALENDVTYAWDDSGNAWNALSGTASIPVATGASGGGTLGKATFDTDAGLAVAAGVVSANIDAVTIDFTAGVMGVTGVPLNFEVNGVATGNDVTAANLDTLTNTSNADALHTHASAVATEAPKIENTLTTATDATADGDPVYQNGNDTVGKATAADTAKARIVGVIRTGSGAAGATPDVTSVGPCAGVLAAATFNTPYYVGDAGGLDTFGNISAGNRVVRMGFAKNATDLWVDIADLGRKAA